MSHPSERRQHPRFRMPHMYTPIALRRVDEEHFDHHGHAYDLSLGGVRFELDRGIEPGTPVVLQLMLPSLRLTEGADGPRRAIFAFANIVWIEDEFEPGPVRMAAAFTRFARAGDDVRLSRHLNHSRYAAAA